MLHQPVEWKYQKEGSLTRKINELARLTGVTTCALCYYDQIGLLKPAEISESGYRLYDDKALGTLQQILFFRELDVPLKQIKAILESPNGIAKFRDM